MGIEKEIAHYFSRHPKLNDQKARAVAVSGGPDSMALAHALILHCPDKDIHLLTVDHGLRSESAEEAQMVTRWLESLNKDNVHHAVIPWKGEKPETGVMEAARKARYRLMADYCEEHGVSTLFIAHHQDDQAETFLIRLSKGSGLDGLSAMQDVREYDDNLILARPLLNVEKSKLVEYCQLNNIPFTDDPSNENEKYLRPRLRQSMRVLSEEGLSSKRLAFTAKRMARARQALEQISEEVFKTCLQEKSLEKISLDFISLKKQPEEIGLRVLQKGIGFMRPEADYQVRLERLEELFADLWVAPEKFKPRTLGGCVFALKDKNKSLWIGKEKG